MIDDADRELFADGLRRATEAHTGAALDGALDELGWEDALASDPHAAVSILFELQGAANATSSAIDRVVTSSLGTDGRTVLPALGMTAPPGSLNDDAVVVHGMATAGLADDAQVSLAVATPGGDAVAVVATAELELRTVKGLDPWLSLVEVSGVAVGATTGPAAAPWAGAVRTAQLALSHELVGAARRMLALAREHALDRVQFGRPISSFQAVRHRLAETLVAIEAADAVIAMAWDDGTPESAAMAKAMAGRGARTAARHAQQVLAGIGFTTEHPLHRYVRRVLVLDQLFGASRTLTRDLGNELIRTRELPPLQPL